MERLQKIIADRGYCSRRKAEKLIEEGKVKVNGKTVKTLGAKANLNDVITVEGNTLKEETKEYILLYKPRGCLSTTKDDKGRKTVLDLIETNNRLYPIGRLDYDTSGLLLLTNDGKLTNILTHPSSNIDKVYIVKIDEKVDPKQIKKLENGILIGNHKTAKAKTKIKKLTKDKSIISITIHEGKYHQVKKMFEQVGYKVSSLKREKYAFLTLKGLSSGEYRHLTVKEVKKLYSLKK